MPERTSDSKTPGWASWRLTRCEGQRPSTRCWPRFRTDGARGSRRRRRGGRRGWRIRGGRRRRAKGGGATTSTGRRSFAPPPGRSVAARARARARPSPPVVDLSEEPKTSTSTSRRHPRQHPRRRSRRRPATASSVSTRSPRRGCAAATRGPLSDTCRTRRTPGKAAAAAPRARGGGRGWDEGRRLKAAGVKRRADRAARCRRFGEESRPTPEMFDASELAARRERERAGRARPRALRTEYGDVMDR